MSRINLYFAALCLSLMSFNTVYAGEPIVSFNKKDLSGFYTYLGGEKNADPDGVFSVTKDGLLKISGEHRGYLSTAKPLSNYRLEAEFKWGAGDASSDSGIFFHAVEEDKMWAKSLEVQMRAGATGDLCLIGKGAALAADGKSWTRGCIPRPGKGDPRKEIEEKRGDWNKIQLICKGDTVELTINGKKILAGTNAHASSGRIYFQCYSGELFYREIAFYPLAD
jgi:hypothetical protein